MQSFMYLKIRVNTASVRAGRRLILLYLPHVRKKYSAAAFD